MNADDINAIIENASNLAFQNDQEIALSFGEGPDMVSITVNPLEEDDDDPIVPRSDVEIITNGVVSGLVVIAVAVVLFFFIGGRLFFPA